MRRVKKGVFSCEERVKYMTFNIANIGKIWDKKGLWLKKIIRNFCRENGNFFPKNLIQKSLVRRKNFPSPQTWRQVSATVYMHKTKNKSCTRARFSTLLVIVGYKKNRWVFNSDLNWATDTCALTNWSWKAVPFSGSRDRELMHDCQTSDLCELRQSPSRGWLESSRSGSRAIAVCCLSVGVGLRDVISEIEIFY